VTGSAVTNGKKWNFILETINRFFIPLFMEAVNKERFFWKAG
jgi:hypothetical protein